MPETYEHSQLYDLIKLYQLYRHSKTCPKNKNHVYSFDFGSFSHRF